jgi:hypothetical protein
MIEQGFGWAKTVGRMRQVMVRGLKKVDQMFVLNMAAYNLVRMRSLGQVRSGSNCGNEAKNRPQTAEKQAGFALKFRNAENCAAVAAQSKGRCFRRAVFPQPARRQSRCSANRNCYFV